MFIDDIKQLIDTGLVTNYRKEVNRGNMVASYVNDTIVAIDNFSAKGLRVAYIDVDSRHGNGVPGGVFLGAGDLQGAGIVDMGYRVTGEEKDAILAEIGGIVAFDEKHTLPLIGEERGRGN